MPGFARILAVLAFLVAATVPLRAEPDYPAFTGLVVDAAKVLTPGDKAELTRKLEDLQKKTGVQFAVATVPALGGDEIEPYANALFRKWGVGQKGPNNGLLLILAPNERKLRFEVGYGLEGTMTDAQSKLILRNDMVPKLKAGDPAGALKAGVDDAVLVLTKDKANLPERLRTPSDAMDPTTSLFIGLFITAFIVIFIISVFRRNRGRGWSRSWAWGPGGFVGGMSSGSDSSGGFSSGDSSSGGGDSFSGGGGGDSGGGGASDSY